MMVRALRPGGRLGIIGFQSSEHPVGARFNGLFRAMGVLFGGVDMDRDVPELVRRHCRPICFEPCFGGFYYILVAEMPAEAA